MYFSCVMPSLNQKNYHCQKVRSRTTTAAVVQRKKNCVRNERTYLSGDKAFEKLNKLELELITWMG